MLRKGFRRRELCGLVGRAVRCHGLHRSVCYRSLQRQRGLRCLARGQSETSLSPLISFNTASGATPQRFAARRKRCHVQEFLHRPHLLLRVCVRQRQGLFHTPPGQHTQRLEYVPIFIWNWIHVVPLPDRERTQTPRRCRHVVSAAALPRRRTADLCLPSPCRPAAAAAAAPPHPIPRLSPGDPRCLRTGWPCPALPLRLLGRQLRPDHQGRALRRWGTCAAAQRPSLMSQIPNAPLVARNHIRFEYNPRELWNSRSLRMYMRGGVCVCVCVCVLVVVVLLLLVVVVGGQGNKCQGVSKCGQAVVWVADRQMGTPLVVDVDDRVRVGGVQPGPFQFRAVLCRGHEKEW